MHNLGATCVHSEAGSNWLNDNQSRDNILQG